MLWKENARMDKDLVMPQPAVNDLSKASQKELIEEVKTLRQFTGLMLLRLRGYVEGQELSNAMEERMASFEKEAYAFREMLADAYYGREPKNIKAFAGRTVKVYGMMLFEQPGGWKGKDQLWHQEGYFQVRMLIEDSDTKGEPIVCVKSSGAGLARHVYHILNNRGWFLFEQPITYRVEIGEDNAHRILNVEQDLKKQLKERAK